MEQEQPSVQAAANAGAAVIPYADRLNAILARPGLMEEIYEYVANGGSLIDLCKSLDIRYSDLAKWLSADKDRVRRWADADAASREWMKKTILREFMLIATLDLRDAYDAQGNLLPIKEMPENIARCISAVEVDELFEGFGKDREKIGVTKKVKFWSKEKALETLGKEFGMFTQKLNVEGKMSLEDLVAGSWEKPAA